MCPLLDFDADLDMVDRGLGDAIADKAHPIVAAAGIEIVTASGVRIKVVVSVTVEICVAVLDTNEAVLDTNELVLEGTITISFRPHSAPH